MKFHRNTIWLIPLIFIVTFPLWSIPVGNFLAPRSSSNPAPKNPQSDSHNFNLDTVKILQNQNGKKTALIRARKAHTGEEDPDLIIMEFVNADLFDEEGNITHVIANTGKYSTTSKILTLIGDVVVNKTQDNQFLYTDLLLYDSEQRTIKCPGKTRLEGEEVVVDGGRLNYDIRSRTYVIDKRVKCTIHGFIQP
jgi:LPS export ABC transporter protein LptC